MRGVALGSRGSSGTAGARAHVTCRSAVRSAYARNPLHGGTRRRKIPPKLTAAAGWAKFAARKSSESVPIRQPLAVVTDCVGRAVRWRGPVERRRRRISRYRFENRTRGDRMKLGEGGCVVCALARGNWPVAARAAAPGQAVHPALLARRRVTFAFAGRARMVSAAAIRWQTRGKARGLTIPPRQQGAVAAGCQQSGKGQEREIRNIQHEALTAHGPFGAANPYAASDRAPGIL